MGYIYSNPCLGFEADLELAVRYEANAAEYLDADDFHDLKEIEDFLDNIRHITEQIQLEQCTELDQEYQKSSKWLKKYHKYFKSNSSTGSEPSLHVAKALLDLSDDLAIQPSEVSFAFHLMQISNQSWRDCKGLNSKLQN